MKVHFINEQDTDIVFFPESKRFFKVSKKALQLFKMIQDNEEDENICNVLNISLEELQGYRHQFVNIFGYIITMVGMATIVSRLNPYLVFVMFIIVFINTIAESYVKKRTYN